MSQADLGELGERIRRAIAGTVVQEGEQRIAVTVSVGGASHPENKVETYEALVALADTALYAAKNAGRDRFRLA